MTQYTFSAEEETVVMSVTAARIMVDMDWAISHQHDWRKVED